MESLDLRKAGLKVTLPRVKILEILENSVEHHLSAEDIYKILLESREEIGLATVYRVLTQFEAAGIVHRHHFEGGQAVFELGALARAVERHEERLVFVAVAVAVDHDRQIGGDVGHVGLDVDLDRRLQAPIAERVRVDS